MASVSFTSTSEYDEVLNLKDVRRARRSGRMVEIFYDEGTEISYNFKDVEGAKDVMRQIENSL